VALRYNGGMYLTPWQLFLLIAAAIYMGWLLKQYHDGEIGL
jgi:hypothetical protein